jgi:HAD superfamily hydrolase (TIGR01544 family)
MTQDDSIIQDLNFVKDTVNRINHSDFAKLHVLADFDKTLTKSFSQWKIRPSLVSLLRSEGYLSEEYTNRAYALYNHYHPIEIDHTISLVDRKQQMTTRWKEHMQLLVDSGLHQSHIRSIVESGILELRSGIRKFLTFLYEHHIPLVIISANALWTDSIKMYLDQQWLYHDNIFIISNEFVRDATGKAISYDPRVIHVFNKDETVLHDFPHIYQHIADRPDVILMWDSLWDPGMITGFEYKNLLKIGFLNENIEELLPEYQKQYDILYTHDSDAESLLEIIT